MVGEGIPTIVNVAPLGTILLPMVGHAVSTLLPPLRMWQKKTLLWLFLGKGSSSRPPCPPSLRPFSKVRPDYFPDCIRRSSFPCRSSLVLSVLALVVCCSAGRYDRWTMRVPARASPILLVQVLRRGVHEVGNLVRSFGRISS